MTEIEEVSTFVRHARIQTPLSPLLCEQTIHQLLIRVAHLCVLGLSSHLFIDSPRE